jgi:hypothetical protein
VVPGLAQTRTSEGFAIAQWGHRPTPSKTGPKFFPLLLVSTLAVIGIFDLPPVTVRLLN